MRGTTAAPEAVVPASRVWVRSADPRRQLIAKQADPAMTLDDGRSSPEAAQEGPVLDFWRLWLLSGFVLVG